MEWTSLPILHPQGQRRLRARTGCKEIGGKLSIDNFSLSQCFANRSCLLLMPACPPLPQGSSQNCPALCGRALGGYDGQVQEAEAAWTQPGQDQTGASLLPCCSAQVWDAKVGLAKLWLGDLGKVTDPL